MNETKRRLINNAAKLFDLGVLLAAFCLTIVCLYSDANNWSLRQFLELRIKLGNFIVFILFAAIWHLSFALCGLYDSKRLSSWYSVSVEVVKATTLFVAAAIGVAIACQSRTVTPYFLAVFWGISVTFLLSGRLVIRYLLGQLRSRGRNSRYLLILGTNPRAVAFARRIQANPQFGYRIVGFADEAWSGTGDFQNAGYRLCSDLGGVAEFLRHNVVDEVAIYLPLRSFYEHAAQIAALCESHGILMRFDSQIFNLKIARSGADELYGTSQIMASTGALPGVQVIMKRTLDYTVSFSLITLLSPLFLMVALLIKWTSPGPIFFSQKRVGLNKRQFLMYKFRTMVPNAEELQDTLLDQNEMTGPVFKIRNDPRNTPIGRILRKTSLDELPQLLNVIKGDMSLVGPRAMSLRDYAHFNEDWQRRRFSVYPGITCLWQVNGRNSVPFTQWMELDMQYIDKWSLWLDLKILARTIPAVLKGSGAA
jgi:exopolysaccharide biosynthesis polyprenyl glycosylphosphotransferase